MELKGPLSCSQKTTTEPYLDMFNLIHIFSPNFFTIHFNINLAFIFMSRRWSQTLGFASKISCALTIYMPHSTQFL
jgi:hypothetical protein